MNKSQQYLAVGITCILSVFTHLVSAQVGIGNTNPQAALDVQSSEFGILIPRVQLSSVTDNTTIKAPDGNQVVNSTLIYNISGTGSGNNYIGKGFHYWDNNRWIAFTDADWFRRFSTQVPNNINDDIYTNGQVGIGTTTPDYSLEIDGSVLLREGNEFLIGNGPLSSNNGMRLSHDGTNTYFDSRGLSTLIRGSNIDTGAGNRVLMRISNETGHVAIGPSNPLERLHVQEGNLRIDTDYRLQFGEYYENTDPINIRRVNIGADVTELQMTLGDNDVTGDPAEDYFTIGIRNPSTNVFVEKYKFGSTGTAFKPGGGSWAALSDRRVKKNIEPFTYGLEAINNVQPVTYEYNELSGYSNSGQAYVGVIAQEIETVLPMTVTKHNEKGFEDLRKYDPTALTYALINSVKELSYQNDRLEEKASNLEAMANELEKQLAKLGSDE